jgi:hypothetical protein
MVAASVARWAAVRASTRASKSVAWMVGKRDVHLDAHWVAALADWSVVLMVALMAENLDANWVAWMDSS